MTLVRGRGPAARERGRRLSLGRVTSALACALIATACGLPADRSSVAPASLSGTASPAVNPSAGGSQPTSWPGQTVLGVVALGAADGEIAKAGQDLQAAVEGEDVPRMRAAADGLVALLEDLMPNVERLEAYPYTADLGRLYRASFPVMLEGARSIRDAIDSGDSGRVEEGFRQLATGIQTYGQARRLLGPIFDQAVVQQRLLVR